MDTTKWHRWGSNQRPFDPECSTRTLSHCSPWLIINSAPIMFPFHRLCAKHTHPLSADSVFIHLYYSFVMGLPVVNTSLGRQFQLVCSIKYSIIWGRSQPNCLGQSWAKWLQRQVCSKQTKRTYIRLWTEAGEKCFLNCRWCHFNFCYLVVK